jgi:hypothetical protein
MKTVKKDFRLPIRTLQIIYRIQRASTITGQEGTDNTTKIIIEAIENYAQRVQALKHDFRIPQQCKAYGYRQGNKIYCNVKHNTVEFPYACIICEIP